MKPGRRRHEWETALWTSGVAPTARLVAFALWSFADTDGKNCYPSFTGLQGRTGLARSTINRALSELRDSGFLEVEKFLKGGLPRSRYSFVTPCSPAGSAEELVAQSNQFDSETGTGSAAKPGLVAPRYSTSSLTSSLTSPLSAAAGDGGGVSGSEPKKTRKLRWTDSLRARHLERARRAIDEINATVGGTGSAFARWATLSSRERAIEDRARALGLKIADLDGFWSAVEPILPLVSSYCAGWSDSGRDLETILRVPKRASGTDHYQRLTERLATRGATQGTAAPEPFRAADEPEDPSEAQDSAAFLASLRGASA
ncbi:MAG: helix-turn-helix domain-containing protein [Planctomycetota bacterium]